VWREQFGSRCNLQRDITKLIGTAQENQYLNIGKLEIRGSARRLKLSALGPNVVSRRRAPVVLDLAREQDDQSRGFIGVHRGVVHKHGVGGTH